MNESFLNGNVEPERYEFFEEPRYQFEVDRRDFLKFVGGGLLVALVLGEAWGQRPGGGQRVAAAAALGEEHGAVVVRIVVRKLDALGAAGREGQCNA